MQLKQMTLCGINTPPQVNASPAGELLSDSRRGCTSCGNCNHDHGSEGGQQMFHTWQHGDAELDGGGCFDELDALEPELELEAILHELEHDALLQDILHGGFDGAGIDEELGGAGFDEAWPCGGTG